VREELYQWLLNFSNTQAQDLKVNSSGYIVAKNQSRRVDMCRGKHIAYGGPGVVGAKMRGMGGKGSCTLGEKSTK